jgi:hypothetical protein
MDAIFYAFDERLTPPAARCFVRARFTDRGSTSSAARFSGPFFWISSSHTDPVALGVVARNNHHGSLFAWFAGEPAVRYYFHIRDGEKIEKDLEGSEFDALELAIEDARLAAREIMAQEVLKGFEPDGQFFDIADEDGHVLAKVPFRSALRSK